jgi:pyruvate/2-oxoglutarate/acetoin dehydrogenase E1 component
MMNYKDEITKAMNMLAQDPRTYFIGQTVKYSGSVLSDTLKDVSDDKKIEFPVAEELQLGCGIGMAISIDIIPVLIYPRIDFLLLAINQLSNHLDVLDDLTNGQYKAKIIIRTIIGAKKPLYPGIQHCRDLAGVFRVLLHNVDVVRLADASHVMSTYKNALESECSTLIVEDAELYG